MIDKPAARHGNFADMLRGDSAARCFLNQVVKEISFEYPVLDVGGGSQYIYHQMMGTDPRRTIIMNLPRVDYEDIDVIASAEETFPFDDGEFGAVLCFNILEHLFDYRRCIEEAYRVLRGEGSLMVFVPFLHNVHGDPADYNRFTEQKLRRELKAFRSVSVVALDTGPLGAGFYQISPLLKLNWVKYTSWRIAVSIDTWLKRWLPRYAELFTNKYPIAYFVLARKG